MEQNNNEIDVLDSPDVELYESEEMLKHPDREKKKLLLIHIKTIDARKSFRFRESELIGRVKIHAMRHFGIDMSQVAQYFFLFQGRRLDELKTLEQDHIPNKAELFLKNEPAVG